MAGYLHLGSWLATPYTPTHATHNHRSNRSNVPATHPVVESSPVQLGKGTGMSRIHQLCHAGG
jgi:hypothetical protein